jgi:hypothetical protein
VNGASSPAGRSAVLRAQRRERGRTHAYGVRLLATLAVIAVAVTLVLTVTNRLLPEEGPGAVLYLLHDAVFLPIKGWTWTAWHPFGFAWWLPVAAIVSLFALEALTSLGPLRRTHAAAVRALFASGVGFGALRVIAWRLRLRGFRLGFVRAVLATDTVAAAQTLFQPHAAPDARAVLRYLRLMDLWLILGRGGPLDRLRAFEALAFASAAAGVTWEDAAVATLERDLTRAFDADPVWLEAVQALRTPRDGFALELADFIHGTLHGVNATDPIGMARAVIHASLDVVHSGDPLVLTAFQAWTRSRFALRDAVGTEQARAVEAVIAFEYWAALAEASIRDTPADPLLADALADSPARAAFGESFAWDGTNP